MLSTEIEVWDYSYSGRYLPDTIPDLAEALFQNPRLRVLAINDYHDLATPFRVTEVDLARLASDRVRVRNYAGGYMTYLDDVSRPQQCSDLITLYAESLAARPVASTGARAVSAAALIAQPDKAGTLQPPGALLPPEPAFQSRMTDPYVPRRAPH